MSESHLPFRYLFSTSVLNLQLGGKRLEADGFMVASVVLMDVAMPNDRCRRGPLETTGFPVQRPCP